MSTFPQNKHSWVGIFFLFCLTGLSVFIYWQFDRSYRSLETSHRMSNHMITLLQRQKTDLVSEYEKELAHFRENLAATEDLLTRIKQENAQLTERVELLNQMAQLQTSVQELQGENEQIKKEVAQLQEIAETQFDTAEEGYVLLRRYENKARTVKQRIRALENAARQEHDRMLARLGNNGYVVKGGEVMPMDVQNAAGEKNIRVDVRFYN